MPILSGSFKDKGGSGPRLDMEHGMTEGKCIVEIAGCGADDDQNPLYHLLLPLLLC